ncbi:MAG: hypothetical protein KME13_08245 [Myxacorys californica WJT36-NPBG1]|jgi:hypothetical protein|nr:hypothetical protein [Myxacorys californica WJT36-NPBG1]
MFHSTFSDSLETALEHEIIGHVAIGQYRLAVGSKHGVLLTVTETPVAAPMLRATPISQLPDAPNLIGRKAELELARSALHTHRTLEICGEPGVGKSAFLKQLILHPQVSPGGANSEGLAQPNRFYIGQPLTVSEVFQHLFEAFYTTPTGVQRSIHEMQRALRARCAIIALDSPTLTEPEINRIKAALPNCTLIVASRRRVGTAEVTVASESPLLIELSGLTLEETCLLLERELGQVASHGRAPVTPEQRPFEQTTLKSLWQLLEGNPQRLLQAAALVREDRVSLEHTLQYIQTNEPIRTFTRLSLASLPKSQRWIVALLTAMGGTGLRAEQIAAMVGPPNPYPSLQSLLERHLIQCINDRYVLTDGLADVLQAEFNATPWMERAIAYLIPWAETHQSQHTEILGEHRVLMYGLHWMMEQRRWRDGLRLISAIEVALVLGNQWEAWRQALRWSLKAAWALSDEQIEAWAMHQLGTLSFCQERITEAYDALTEALRIRRANLGNELATTLTRHNLAQIKETVLPSKLKYPTLRLDQRRTYRTLALIGMLVFLASVLIGLAISQRLMQRPSGGDMLNPTPLQK